MFTDCIIISMVPLASVIGYLHLGSVVEVAILIGLTTTGDESRSIQIGVALLLPGNSNMSNDIIHNRLLRIRDSHG